MAARGSLQSLKHPSFILLLMFMAGLHQGECLVRGIARAVRIVTKPVERVVKHATKPLERVVRHAVKPVKLVVKNVVEKPLKKVLKPVLQTLGLRTKRVKKTYTEFVQETRHARVVFTEDSYIVEKVEPCADGQHEIVNTGQPVEIHFEGSDKVVIQDRYCKKCGMHFYGEPKDEL